MSELNKGGADGPQVLLALVEGLQSAYGSGRKALSSKPPEPPRNPKNPKPANPKGLRLFGFRTSRFRDQGRLV